MPGTAAEVASSTAHSDQLFAPIFLSASNRFRPFDPCRSGSTTETSLVKDLSSARNSLVEWGKRGKLTCRHPLVLRLPARNLKLVQMRGIWITLIVRNVIPVINIFGPLGRKLSALLCGVDKGHFPATKGPKVATTKPALLEDCLRRLVGLEVEEVRELQRAIFIAHGRCGHGLPFPAFRREFGLLWRW